MGSIKHCTALLLGTLAACGWAQGALVYSGLLDIPITPTLGGVYLDVEGSGTSSGDPSSGSADATSYTVSNPQPGNWDVNFFFGGIAGAYSPTLQPFVDDPSDNISRILNVSQGTVIDSSSAAANTLTVVGFGGSGQTNNSTVGESHFGAGSDAFTPGTEGYIAFVLNPDTTPLYGWMRVTLENDGSAGVIHDWAFSENSIVVGVPEPSALALLLLAATGLLVRKRA